MNLISKKDFISGYGNYYIKKLSYVTPSITIEIEGRIIKNDPLDNKSRFCKCEDFKIRVQGTNDAGNTPLPKLNYFSKDATFKSNSPSFSIIIEELNDFCMNMLNDINYTKVNLHISKENINKLKKEELFYVDTLSSELFKNYNMFLKGNISSYLIDNCLLKRYLFKDISIFHPVEKEIPYISKCLEMNELYVYDNVTVNLDNIYKLIEGNSIKDVWKKETEEVQNIMASILNSHITNTKIVASHMPLTDKIINTLKKYVKEKLGIYSYKDLIESGYNIIGDLK